jgi:flagellar basal-body rod modification protein FlgD
MSVNSVNNTSNVNNTQNNVTSKKELGKDDFLKMMIAQLKNQDPLNPMDSSQYSAQLAQFSTLEQITNLNQSMKEFLNTNLMASQAINNALSANLIGKEVKIDNQIFEYNGQDKISFGYKLTTSTNKVNISIYDQNGNLVKSFENINSNAGENHFEWDFKNSNGLNVPQGSYRIVIDAKNIAGEKLDTKIYQFGKVNSIKFSQDGAKLVINGIEYNLSDVIEISNG